MVRSLGALLAGLLLVQAGAVRAADEAAAPAGSWKMTLPFQGADVAAEARIQGRQMDRDGDPRREGRPKPRSQNIAVADGVLKFDLRLEQQGLTLPFEGALPKEGDKIRGSVLLNGKAQPAELDKTTLTSFDPYDQLKEDLVKQAGAGRGRGDGP